MEKLTQQKFTEYKNDLDGKNTGSSDYMNDYAKVEKIITFLMIYFIIGLSLFLVKKKFNFSKNKISYKNKYKYDT